MKTKEEILRKHFKESIPDEFHGKLWDDRLLYAIDEYAKEHAIAFLNWVWINNYTDDNDAFELYDIFKNENQEK